MLRRYIPGPGTDQPIAMVTPAGASHARSYFHVNRQGSTVAMSNDAGTVSEGPYTYDAYGQGPTSAGVPFKYTGRRLDPETGLYYYRARYYSAALGRFLQTDPIGYGDDMNMYAYVGADPVNATDPSGEDTYVCYGGRWVQVDCYGDVEEGTNSTDVVFIYEGKEIYRDRVNGGISNPATLESLRELASQRYGAVRGFMGDVDQDRKQPSPERGKFQSNKEADLQAQENGWQRVPGSQSRNQPVYRDQKGNYYTRDLDGHRGGAWKGSKDPDKFGPETRTGTYDRRGKWIAE